MVYSAGSFAWSFCGTCLCSTCARVAELAGLRWIQLQSKTSDLAHSVQIIQLRPRPLHVSNIKSVRFAGGFNEPRNTHSLHFEAVGQTETAQKWDAFGDVFSPVSLDATFAHEWRCRKAYHVTNGRERIFIPKLLCRERKQQEEAYWWSWLASFRRSFHCWKVETCFLFPSALHAMKVLTPP